MTAADIRTEDAFTIGKQCLGWEDVQVLADAAVRTLVALGWVAAGFLYELSVTLEWPEVRLLTRLGGGELRVNRSPGKLVLTRGLRCLLDLPPVLPPGTVYCGATACPARSAAELDDATGEEGSFPHLYPEVPGRYLVELAVTGDVTARETVEVEVGGP